MRLLETGNHLVAHAVNAVNVDVVPAYPITPQTQVVEKIAELIAEGKMDAEYIPVESEHSACAALVASSLTGVRSFSATSSHGLAYMHEELHYAAGIRVPVLMANINRAIGPGWNIWCDHQDSIAQRDTGWLQVYVSSHQEAVDTVIQGYRITENSDVMLPLMLNLDAFVMSHTYMVADIPSMDEVARYLPPYRPLWKLDTRKPVSHGAVVYPIDFSETRKSIQEAQEAARTVAVEAAEEFREMFGRWHGGLVEEYRLDDAEYVIVAMGSLAAESKVAVDTLRENGKKVGLVRIRFYRPFPIDEVRALCGDRRGLLVIDRDYSYGMEGALYTEVKASLYGKSDLPVYNLIVGLGGRDVTFELIAGFVERSMNGEMDEIEWGDTAISEAHLKTRVLLEEFRELQES